MTDRDEVLAAATRRARALAESDEPALRELLHPRFGWISHRGASFDLENYLSANVTGEIRWQAQELRDVGVTVVGDTAVLRCLVVDQVIAGAGRAETYVMPMTQIWVRADHRWRCLGGHAGPRLADDPSGIRAG